PEEADATAYELPSFDLEALSERNIRRELASFQETCDKIKQKHLLAPSPFRPRWLLVIVNKADLFWDGVAQARDYYAPHSGSVFDGYAQSLMRQLGTLAIRYEVFPVALRAADFSFQSNRGNLEVASQLGPEHAGG